MSAEKGAVGVGSAMEASRSRERSLSEADGRETEGRRTMVGRGEGKDQWQCCSSAWEGKKGYQVSAATRRVGDRVWNGSSGSQCRLMS